MNFKHLESKNPQTKKVYIASPYSIGKQSTNVRRQIDAGNILMDLGYFPYVPLLMHFQEIIHHRPEHEWLSLDFCWLKTCDIMVRLRPLDTEGKEIPSLGADMEEELANTNNIPVYDFNTLEEMKEYFETTKI